jgi:hypothetical protein
MGGHYRREFTDTVTHVQRLSVSIAVITVRETRGAINSQSMITGYKTVVRRMIDKIKGDVAILSQDSDRYRLKRMQLALYILLNQVLNVQSPTKRYGDLKDLYFFMDRLQTTTFDQWKEFLITGSTEFFDNKF